MKLENSKRLIDLGLFVNSYLLLNHLPYFGFLLGRRGCHLWRWSTRRLHYLGLVLLLLQVNYYLYFCDC